MELMIDQTAQVVASGVGVVWVLLWSLGFYTELGSDRQSPVRMGFYLSVAAVGLWMVMTIAVLAIGYAVIWLF